MRPQRFRKLLARRSQAEFRGRDEEIAMMLGWAADSNFTGSTIAHAPRRGATELLQQVFDRLFLSQTKTVPIYFSFKNAAGPREAARRFAMEFLMQLAAFQTQEPEVFFAPPTLTELSAMVSPSEAAFVEKEAASIISRENDADETAFFRYCFSLPLRAAAAGLHLFVMLDDLHRLAETVNGSEAVSALEFLTTRGGLPFCIAMRRRFRFDGDIPRYDLQPLESKYISEVISAAAENRRVKVSDAVCDLIEVKADGDLSIIHGIISDAARLGRQMDSFKALSHIYTGAVFGGPIREIYDRIFSEACISTDVEKTVIRLLHESFTSESHRLAADVWKKLTGLSDIDTHILIDRLSLEEVVRFASARVEPTIENRCLADYVATRYRLEVLGEDRAPVFALSLSSFISTAPQLMAEEYRRASALGLRNILAAFGERKVPLALLDYGRYKRDYRGLEADELVKKLEADNDLIALPGIVFSSYTESFYRAIGLLTEKERSAVALGFEKNENNGNRQIVWIAAEIDAKLEVDRETAEFWCDRLETAALMCGFENYRLWLVAPEGFTDEALEVLYSRNCFTSSHRQAQLLNSYLTAAPLAHVNGNVREYEIVIPMEDDSELVAAHTLENIAKRHNFPAHVINQIKTALVEACINASEHSRSPDRKIHQKFAVSSDRITITVSNRGIRLADIGDKEEHHRAEGVRRGWGLKLIRSLMDEVTIEDVDDGTRISMTKILEPA